MRPLSAGTLGMIIQLAMPLALCSCGSLARDRTVLLPTTVPTVDLLDISPSLGLACRARQNYNFGGAIIVDIEVTNIGQSRVFFPGNDPLRDFLANGYWQGHPLQRTDFGKLLQANEEQNPDLPAENLFDQSSDCIEPGGVAKYKFDMSKVFNVDKIGSYSIVLRRRFLRHGDPAVLTAASNFEVRGK